MAEKTIFATLTGEYFQPVRLHYQVLDHEGLNRDFKKLRCVDYDATQQRWVWLYDYEAKRLRFKQSYDQIPKQHHPIIIGSFFLREKDKLLLDLRSCERAVLAIQFFAKHLRRVVKVTEAEVVNKLFGGVGNAQLTPTSIFDQQTSTVCDPEALVKRLVDLTAHVTDPQEKMDILHKDIEAQARKPLPEIERLPVHFHEEGIQGFANALKLRQIVALQHWLGNTGYTMFDSIQAIQKSME